MEFLILLFLLRILFCLKNICLCITTLAINSTALYVITSLDLLRLSSLVVLTICFYSYFWDEPT